MNEEPKKRALSQQQINEQLYQHFGLSKHDLEWLKPWAKAYTFIGLPVMIGGFGLMRSYLDDSVLSIVVANLLGIIGLEMSVFGLLSLFIIYKDDTRIPWAEYIVGLIIDAFKPGGKTGGFDGYPFIEDEIRRINNAHRRDPDYIIPEYYDLLIEMMSMKNHDFMVTTEKKKARNTASDHIIDEDF